MTHGVLSDRGVIAVTGEEAESFLNRMFTNSTLEMPPGTARFAALLSPQGKLLFDFFVVRQGDGFLLDCVGPQATDLAKKLSMFKLRAKVAIVDRSADLGVAAVWDSVLMEAPGQAFRDPRHNDLGYRVIAAHDRLAAYGGDNDAYDAHRIALGIPKGGVDFEYGDTFVHDANMDLLHGVDFKKGCYVGQEVVSRVQHRGSVRKRIARLLFKSAVPALGSEIKAGETALGALTSASGETALAALRIDRLADAEAAGIPVIVAGIPVAGVSLPAISEVEPPAYAQDLY